MSTTLGEHLRVVSAVQPCHRYGSKGVRLKVRTLILSAIVAITSSLALAAPASASCTEWIEGRCLENDVCAAANKVRPTNCID